MEGEEDGEEEGQREEDEVISCLLRHKSSSSVDIQSGRPRKEKQPTQTNKQPK